MISFGSCLRLGLLTDPSFCTLFYLHRDDALHRFLDFFFV
jgi:hypothetical protein